MYHTIFFKSNIILIGIRLTLQGGWTPLHEAAETGAFEVVRILLADPRVDVHAESLVRIAS